MNLVSIIMLELWEHQIQVENGDEPRNKVGELETLNTWKIIKVHRVEGGDFN